MIEKRDFYIGGRWVPPAVPADCEVFDPSTEAVCAVISLGGKDDADRAVSAARRALEGWSQTTAEERLAILENVLSLYRKRADAIAGAISLEMGAPIDLARSRQVPAGERHIRDFRRNSQALSIRENAGATRAE